MGLSNYWYDFLLHGRVTIYFMIMDEGQCTVTKRIGIVSILNVKYCAAVKGSMPPRLSNS